MLQVTSITDQWGDEQQKAFLMLKIAVTSEPLLRPPQYDGRVFHVVTDGSKKGFGGMLAQEFEMTDDKGKPHREWHPLAFCSKRTSPSKENYEPFLLEFAALKFALDEFDTIIYGSPIEIKMDCQVLWNVLLNKKQSSTHARWEESITCWNIVDIRHRPGVTNVVADAISRKWSEVRGPSKARDGAEWSIQLDWEANKGVVNDIMQLAARQDTDKFANIREQFADDPWLSEVVNALMNRDMPDIQTRHRAQHCTLNFTIEGGKLWWIHTKAKDRVARVECVPAVKGFELATRTMQTMATSDGTTHGLSYTTSGFGWGWTEIVKKLWLNVPSAKILAHSS